MGIDNSYQIKNYDQTSNKIKVFDKSSVLFFLKDYRVLLYGFVIMLYLGSQAACSSWIPLFAENELQLSPSAASSCMMAFWLGICIMRFLASFILERGINPLRMSVVGLILSGLSLALFPFVCKNAVLLFSGIFFSGFWAGATVSFFVVQVTRWYPKQAAFISIFYLSFGTVGRFVFPYLLTTLAEKHSLGIALSLSSSLLFISSFILFFIAKCWKNQTSCL